MPRHTPIRIQHLSFALPNQTLLFNNLTLSFSPCKTGLVGRNGIGKSTLVRLITGELYPSSGTVQVDGKIAYLPQQIEFSEELHSLSDGEVTRLLLSKKISSDADFLVLDEPTNHLDSRSRKNLYNTLQQWQGGMIVISHDRALLNLMDEIVELTTLGSNRYGGNYDFYAQQKQIEKNARELELQDAKKLLEKNKISIQTSREKHAQKQSYGRKLRKSGSIDKMAAGSKKGRSERTQSRLLIKEERLLNHAETQIKIAHEKIEVVDDLNIELPKTYVPNGKIIVDINNITFSYPNTPSPIIENFNLTIRGPERITLVGSNGSGKTTLVKLLLSELIPQTGKIYIGTEHVRYLDQKMSLLNPDLSILENFLTLNPDANKYDAHRALAQFSFKNITALKRVKDISGGEKLRALLACVLLSNTPPQLLILDEPTNHLDLPSIQNFESALKHYQGTLVVISHDQTFLDNIDITRVVIK